MTPTALTFKNTEVEGSVSVEMNFKSAEFANLLGFEQNCFRYVNNTSNSDLFNLTESLENYPIKGNNNSNISVEVSVSSSSNNSGRVRISIFYDDVRIDDENFSLVNVGKRCLIDTSIYVDVKSESGTLLYEIASSLAILTAQKY